MTTLQVDTPVLAERRCGCSLVGIGSGMFNSPNTAAMMGAVPAERRGIAAGARMMLQNTGAVISIAFVLAIVTAAVPKDVLFKIFSGLATRPRRTRSSSRSSTTCTRRCGCSPPTSLVGAGVSLMRPRHQRDGDEAPAPPRRC